MQIDIQQPDDDTTLIILNGRMDVKGTQVVDQKFAFAATVHRHRVLVDMSRVEFLASIGIRTLFVAARGQHQRGGRLVLFSPQPLVRKVLETAGVDQMIPIADDLDGARRLAEA